MSVIETLGGKFQNMAAPNRFEVTLLYPFGGDTELSTFMCKAATIPGETIGEVILGYQSQKLKLAGDREYADWTVTVYNSEDWTVRNDLEKWMKLINDPVTNFKTSHESYWNDLKITQLGVNSLAPIAVYLLKGAWPGELGEITLDWDSTDEVETFDVTFKYQYFDRL